MVAVPDIISASLDARCLAMLLWRALAAANKERFYQYLWK